MLKELTTEYSMENWRESSKDCILITYSPEKYGEIPDTLSISTERTWKEVTEQTLEKYEKAWKKLADEL
jgi:hypothetical protein